MCDKKRLPIGGISYSIEFAGQDHHLPNEASVALHEKFGLKNCPSQSGRVQVQSMDRWCYWQVLF
jgi:hypothetical protein